MKNQDIIKNQADAIQKFLSNEGVEIPRGKVLDMLARLTGDKEWNALSKRLKASAPGTEKLRYVDVLKGLQSVLNIAKDSLDDASSVVDAGDDEDHAYEAELGLLETEIKSLDVLIGAEKLVKAEGVTLLEVNFPEEDGQIHLLVPAHVNVEMVDQKLCAWLARRDAALDKIYADDFDGEEAEAFAVEVAWNNDAFIAEAVRLGAVAPTKVKLSRRFEHYPGK